MNLKQFFYKGYYNTAFLIKDGKQESYKTVDLKKPLDKNDFKVVKAKNAPVFAAANNKIKNFTWANGDTELLDITTNPGVECFLTINLETTYPGLLIGTGYNHETNNEGEFKLGFYFDHTTGLPVIPGSSVKGTLRSMFPQFKSRHPFLLPKGKDGLPKLDKNQEAKVNYVAELFGIADGEQKTLTVHQLELAIFEGIDIELTQSNFKTGDEVLEYLSPYRRSRFFNAIIYKAKKQGKILDADTITPHDTNPLKNPTPLPFLKVLPKVGFRFQLMIFDIPFLGITKDQIRIVFEEILCTIGIGAKTNVGYGQFNPVDEVDQGGSETIAADPGTVAQPDDVEIPDESALPSLKVKNLLTTRSEWTAQVYMIRNETCRFKIAIDGEVVVLRKKVKNIGFAVKVTDFVTITFIANYAYDKDPQFNVTQTP